MSFRLVQKPLYNKIDFHFQLPSYNYKLSLRRGSVAVGCHPTEKYGFLYDIEVAENLTYPKRDPATMPFIYHRRQQTHSLANISGGWI